MSKGPDEKAQLEHEASKERDSGGGSKRGRGLLNVPSKASSQQVQSSSATTGLSGATANEHRDSIGGHSKESKSSRLGRRRNGSVSSNRSGAGAAPASSTSQPNSSAGGPQRRKKGGLLALLGCCGVPDNANGLEGGEDPLPSHKLDRIPQRPLTSSRRTITPSEQTTASKTQLQEKEKETQPEVQPLSGPAHDIPKPAQPTPAPAAYDQDRVAEAEQPTTTASAPGPSITVNPPVAEQREKEQAAEAATKEEDSDVDMPDADVAAATSQPAEEPVDTADEQLSKPMSAPPPGPIPIAPAPPITQGERSIASEEGEPQKFLLPPVEPHLKGRKCLVLDLDETLVHSSFKILHQADFTIPVEIEGNYHNVYVIKRPGVDQFMKRIGELYEVVVFTASVSKYGDPLLDQLDIHKVVHHRLFRESCYNHQGNYVKDLSQVGRDLKDTIIIDNSPTSYIFHPQHAVPISSWFSDAHDNELLDLIPVLEDLAGPNVRDVSLVLDVTL
ncbi:hypothetical protein DL765_005030 [Monosporascus sp. GIB2]|nr:hypothetical protein DL765_005030 [Monosporascus sp. GIB2]